jgi:hypothetical protein
MVAIRWMSTLVAAFGCALSVFYSFDRAILLAAITFIVALFAIPKALNLDQLFFHPSSVLLDLQGEKEIVFDGAPFRLEMIWASPLLLVLGAVELQLVRPRRVRVLLGRDTLSDEQWSDVQAWRVWCQRG